MSPAATLRAWLRDRAHHALAAVPAGLQAEVHLHYHERGLTRFTRNGIHQHVHDSDGQAQVVLYDAEGRMGAVTTNRLDDAGLEAAVARAAELVRLAAPDPDFPGLTEPQTYPEAPGWDEATANLTPQARAQAVQRIVAHAQAQDLQAAGALSSQARGRFLANSRGLEAYTQGTAAEAIVVMQADEDAWGRAQDASVAWAGLDLDALAAEAADLAARGRDPRPIEPGEYPVVLAPYAVADLLNMLNFHGLSARAVQEGRSWLNGRLGQRVMDPRVHIWDDPLSPATLPLPFDGEGVPKARLDIVRAGVPLTPVYDRRSAAQEGRASTGHGLPPGMRDFGALAGHLFLGSGDASGEALLRAIGRGLFVNRFWYTRLVHPRDCVITGMTRDGVFWVEDGELAYPVKNLRFTQSYVTALAEVLAIGAATRLVTAGFGWGGTRAPALALPAFRFTGRTA
ncbi:MAG: TldD/PmbA family protein [Chloroflexi bacterium]|nr:TldD/PmbA family protein [Chloroflexota bacterium]